MWIKEEVTTGYQLERRLWGQAVDTWKEIFNAGKEEQAMQYFEEIFCDQEAIDLTKKYVNLDEKKSSFGLSATEKERLFLYSLWFCGWD